MFVLKTFFHNRYLISSLFISLFRIKPSLSSSVGVKSMSSTVETCSKSSNQYSIGYITISNSEQAKELAQKLVNGNLVACVNIVPTVTSVYKWKGKIETDNESLMIIKTESVKSDDVIQFVKKNHPYDVPEIIFAPILNGNPDYLKWITESVANK